MAATLSPGAAAIADPGEVLWRFEIPSNVPGAYVATGADGTVYFTDNLRMYALTPDGEPIWTSPVGTGGDKPIVIGADGTLYTANSLIYAIDPADGSLMWEYSTGSNNAILAGPGIGPDDNIYAVQGTINEGVGFFSLDEEGQAQWTVSGDPAPQGFGSDNAPIAFSGNRFFAGFSDNAGQFAGIWAFELDGDQHWHTGGDGLQLPASSAPQLAPNGDIIVRWAQSFIASMTQDGDVNWSVGHPDGASWLRTPTVGPDGVIYRTGDWIGVQLWAINPDGSTRWYLPNGPDNLGTLAVSPDNKTIVTTGGPMIRGYDPADGSLLWQVDLLPEEGLSQGNRSRHPFFSGDGSTAYVLTGFPGDGVGHSDLYAIDLQEDVAGDLNADGTVDSDDRAMFCAAIGSSEGERAFMDDADFDANGTIDHLDQQVFDELHPSCAGDVVASDTFQPPADGMTDGADLAYLLGAWASEPSCADFVASATFEPPPDGLVDGADLAYLLGAWGACE